MQWAGEACHAVGWGGMPCGGLAMYHDPVMLAHLGSVGRVGQFSGDVHPETFHHVHLLVANFHLSNASD